jgi:hypothetical protein
MTHIEVRLGNLDDVDDAVSVYERSNLVRRQGDWPSRPGRQLRQVEDGTFIVEGIGVIRLSFRVFLSDSLLSMLCSRTRLSQHHIIIAQWD